jgi:GAF domain-containing protein
MTELAPDLETIERQELERLLVARTREISALERAARVSGAMGRLEGPELYHQLNQQVVELLDVEMCAILLYDAEQEMLVGQVPAVGVPDAVMREYRIPIGQDSPAHRFWEEAEDLILNDVMNDTLVRAMNLDGLAQRLNIRSTMIAGLRHEGKLLGVLQPSNKRDGTGFDADDARLMAIFANLAAITIQNAGLLKESQRYVEEISSLYEITSALAATVDLDDVLHLILKQVQRVLDYDTAFITLVTSNGQSLRIRAADGKDAAGLLGVEFSLDRGINSWIYREGKAVLLGDTHKDPRRLVIEGRSEAMHAVVGAPLIVDGEPIGTIYAARHKPYAYTEAHLNFLNVTATQVAAAVQRARLLHQARQRAEEMESLYNIGAVMAASLDVDHILQTIYEQASRIMDTSAFFVALCDPVGEELQFNLVYERGERVEPFVILLKDSRGLTAHVVQTAQPLLIHDLQKESDKLPVKPVVIGELTLSWLGVPIVVQDRVLGVLGSQSFESYAFTNRQLRLLSAIANQAGICLQNAQLYAAVQQAHLGAADERDKLDRLHRIVAEIQRADTLKAKLQLIADGIYELGWQHVAVTLRDKDLNVTELVSAGLAPGEEAVLQSKLLPGSEWKKQFAGGFDHYRLGQCIYLPWRDPWVREHIHGEKRSVTLPLDQDAWHPRDLLYVPFYGRDGEILGIIGLDAPQNGRKPTARSLYVVELFAQEAALLIENTRLLEDLKLVNTDLQEMVDAQAHLLQTIEEMIPALSLEKGSGILARLAGGELDRA